MRHHSLMGEQEVRQREELRKGSATHLRQLLEAASGGHPPEPDGIVEVISRPPGPVHAVVAFMSHIVVAADVDEKWVLARLDPDDPGAATRPGFLAELGRHLGAHAGQLDAVLVARGALQGNQGLDLVEVDGTEHHRVRRAQRYRTDVRAWRTKNGTGLVTIGRGLADRWEISFELDAGARGHGLGRLLALACRELVSTDESVYAQVSPGNVASLRALLSSGFSPIASEVLLLDHHWHPEAG